MVQGGEARCGTGYGVGKREGLHRPRHGERRRVRSDHRGERMRGRRPPWRGGWEARRDTSRGVGMEEGTRGSRRSLCGERRGQRQL